LLTFNRGLQSNAISVKPGGELRCSGRVGSICCTSGTRRVNLVTNPIISREWGKTREVLTTSGTYPWSCVTQIVHNSQPRKVTSTLQKWGSCYSIFSCMCMFCRSLFVPLYFFCWYFCCLFFFDIRIMIVPLISSNSSL
jgi:hypothetical protein